MGSWARHAGQRATGGAVRRGVGATATTEDGMNRPIGP